MRIEGTSGIREQEPARPTFISERILDVYYGMKRSEGDGFLDTCFTRVPQSSHYLPAFKGKRRIDR